jgi:aminomethyltransferase
MFACGELATPIWYSGRGVLAEARAVRENVGLFDISYIPRLFVTGSSATDVLSQAVTYDPHRIAVEDSHEALFCSEDGRVLDRLRVHHLGGTRWLLVASGVQHAVDAMRAAIASAPAIDIRVDDRTANTAMLAMQGPMAIEVLSDLLSAAITERTPAWHSTEIELYGHKALLWRTAAPEPDGFAMICSIEAARHLWHLLLAAGATPCGLASREILRQEACQAAVGHELDGDANPFEAGLESMVSLDGVDFRGKPALENLRNQPRRNLVCLAALTRDGIFRQGLAVFNGAKQVGRLTSGGYSPVLGKSIGMAYVPVDLARAGTSLEVKLRGRRLAAAVLPAPNVRSAVQR